MTAHRPRRLHGMALVALVAFAGAAGCAAGNKQVTTPRYTLEHPDFWRVKQAATKDGEATIVVVPQFGDAVIDDGSGAMAEKNANYDSVTADVEVRVYAWGDPGMTDEPTQEVARMLARDADLKLPQHAVIEDHPPDCNFPLKKYTVLGATQEPINLISRPGWQTIVVGGRAPGVLMGAVARVEYQPDPARRCHDLSNMRVQLQNLLDGIKPVVSAQAEPPRSAPATTRPAEPVPAAPSPPPPETPPPPPAPQP